VTALTGLFRAAQPDVVEKAAQAAVALPSLAGCADVAALSAAVPPPEDAAILRALETLRPRRAQASVLNDTGRFKQALQESEPLVQEARAGNSATRTRTSRRS
jgi:eukaryotic-like serine/threonine-protein kinase